MKPKPARPLTARLMQRVRERLDKENKSIADLARFVGKPDNYHQVYLWLNEKVEPKSEAAFLLELYADGKDEELAKQIAATHATA